MAAYVWILYISTGISVMGLIRMWQLRKSPGTPPLAIAIACVGLWSFAYALEISLPGLSAKLFWAKVEYLGIPFVPVGIFIFSLQYTGRSRFSAREQLLIVSSIPAVTVLLTATNELHHLIWTSVQLTPGQALAPLEISHGWFFWVHVLYSYALLLAATYFLLRIVLIPHALYRIQSVIMLSGVFAPWIVNLMYLTGVNPFPYLDLTPLAFLVTNVALSVGFIRFRMMDISPVAYESIVRAMGDAAIVVDQQDRIIEVNPAGERFLQQPATALIGQPLGQLLPTAAQATDASADTAREITLGTGEGRRSYTLRTAPVLNRRGQATGRLVLLTDITELQHAQNQVLLQATALESAENGIVITDTQGTILWVNPAFTRLTGYTREEALGQNPRLLKSGQHAVELYKDLWDTILAGKVWRGEMINRNKGGSLYHEEMTITPLKAKAGAPTHFIGIKQDISKRKQAEEALHAAHQEAVEANRLKTQLLANVSHDLRTPLGAIIGYADMLQEGVYGNLSAGQNGAVREIIGSADQLLMFVNNLIGQAQLETGRIVLKNRPFAPAELVEVARSTGRLLAAKKGLALECEVAPDLPQQLPGDVYWLRQVVLNLVNNAVKFTERGSVVVRLFCPTAQEWAIQVADTGMGIPSEAQATIFDVFKQVDGSATRKYGGSGLGLAIVKELTTLMGGRIDLQSEVGRGSTFTIHLPLAASPEEAA